MKMIMVNKNMIFMENNMKMIMVNENMIFMIENKIEKKLIN